MLRRRIRPETRRAILQAAADARARGPVGIVQDGGRAVLSYDAVDLAVETGNFWFSLEQLDNEVCEAALRLIHMGLRRGCGS